MKIGILTLPLYTNYGGILQTYALQTVLERMGLKEELNGQLTPSVGWLGIQQNTNSKYSYEKSFSFHVG